MATTNIEQFNIEADADASVWAASLGMGEAMFKTLPVGARFSFTTDGKLLTKLARGYRDETGHHFTIGARTACFRR